MNLESQVCTLEQAKKFDALGIKNNSFIKWVYVGECYGGWVITANTHGWPIYRHNEYNAYTSAELGEIINYLHSSTYDKWSYEYLSGNIHLFSSGTLEKMK